MKCGCEIESRANHLPKMAPTLSRNHLIISIMPPEGPDADMRTDGRGRTRARRESRPRATTRPRSDDDDDYGCDRGHTCLGHSVIASSESYILLRHMETERREVQLNKC